MPELKFAAEESRSRMDVFASWFPRVAVTLVFLGIGIDKFAGGSWTTTFDRIGFGQWFRLFTGSMQIAGALLVIIPRTFRVGIVMLMLTMAGAMGIWIFRLGSPGNAVIPAVILGGLTTVALQNWNSR